MARHRKIDVRVWGDLKFRRLSKPNPCGQFLWLYLLTGPHTTALPGMFQAGEAGMAEAIGWPLKAFREAFAEAFREGLVKADWEARVVWIPKAILYNRPESPNVVRSWRASWDELPECELKREAYLGFLKHFEAFGKGFREAFLEAFGEGFGEGVNPTGCGPSPNQEQEQEQEQEQDKGGVPPLPPLAARKKSDPPASLGSMSPDPDPGDLAKPRPRDLLFDAIADVTGTDPKASGSHIGKVVALLKKADPAYTPDEVKAWAVKIRELWGMQPTVGMIEKYIGKIRSSDPLAWSQPGKAGMNGHRTPDDPPQRCLTKEEMDHGWYNAHTGFTKNCRACKNRDCERPGCIAAQGREVPIEP